MEEVPAPPPQSTIVPPPPAASTEINDALQQFQTELTIEGDKPPAAATDFSVPVNSKMVERLMKYSGGLIKDERQAEYVLLGFAAIALGISFYLFFGGGPKATNNPSVLPPGTLPGGISVQGQTPGNPP